MQSKKVKNRLVRSFKGCKSAAEIKQHIIYLFCGWYNVLLSSTAQVYPMKQLILPQTKDLGPHVQICA